MWHLKPENSWIWAGALPFPAAPSLAPSDNASTFLTYPISAQASRVGNKPPSPL